MTHPSPPLSGENLLLDDEDIILLTDEIPSAENPDMIEASQLADSSEPWQVPELSEPSREKPAFIDLTDVIEVSDFKTELPDFSVSETELLNFDLKDSRTPDSLDREPDTPSFTAGVSLPPDTEYQPDDLQRLIDEVVHDSQVPPQDFSGIPPEISNPTDVPAVTDDLSGLSRDQVDAAVERVIRNLFAEKIEPILEQVITTTVDREIQNMKTVLLDYLTCGRTVHNMRS